MPATKTTERGLPAELTLGEAAIVLGIHRSNVHRRFKGSLRWAMHSGRRVRVVSTELVIRAIAAERNEGPALPEIERMKERIVAIIQTQERQAEALAKMARKLGVQV